MHEKTKTLHEQALKLLKELSTVESLLFDEVKGRVVRFDECGKTMRGKVVGIGHDNQWKEPWVYVVVRLMRSDGSIGHIKRYRRLDRVRFVDVEETNR